MAVAVVIQPAKREERLMGLIHGGLLEIHLPAVAVPACGFFAWAHGMVTDGTTLAKEVVGLAILILIAWGIFRGFKSGHVLGALVSAVIVGAVATWAVTSGTLWGAQQVAGETHSAQVSAIVNAANSSQAPPGSGGAC